LPLTVSNGGGGGGKSGGGGGGVFRHNVLVSAAKTVSLVALTLTLIVLIVQARSLYQQHLRFANLQQNIIELDAVEQEFKSLEEKIDLTANSFKRVKAALSPPPSHSIQKSHQQELPRTLD